MESSKPVLALLTLLLLTALSLTSAATETFIYGGCARFKFNPNSPYESNVDSLLTSLVNSAAYNSFNKFTVGGGGSGSGADVVYGLYQCRADLPKPECFSCVQRALSQLGVLCVDSCGGAIQLDGCFVKYDNATFLGVEDKTVVIRKCGPQGFSSDELARQEEVLSYLGSGTELFRIGSAGSVRGVAQCVGDLSVSQCQDCLGEAIGRLRSDCGPVRWGDMFLGKCYARYSSGGGRSYGFNGSSQDDEIEKTLAILIGLIAGVALIIIFLAFLGKLWEGKGDGK